MLRSLAVALCSIVISSSAFAQVFYQPVKYQYDAGGPGDAKYYYGGTNPLVHRLASSDGYGGRCTFHGYAGNLHRFDGGNSFGQPSPLYDRDAVYTDCVPFQDASRFGYTPADARNEAYANSARYFRKADILAGAVLQPDGTWSVPADSSGAVYLLPPTPANRSAEDMLRQMLQPQGQAAQPLKPIPDLPPAIDGTSGPNAVDPNATTQPVTSEGTLLLDRIGRLTPAVDGKSFELTLESDG